MLGMCFFVGLGLLLLFTWLLLLVEWKTGGKEQPRKGFHSCCFKGWIRKGTGCREFGVQTEISPIFSAQSVHQCLVAVWAACKVNEGAHRRAAGGSFPCLAVSPPAGCWSSVPEAVDPRDPMDARGVMGSLSLLATPCSLLS